MRGLREALIALVLAALSGATGASTSLPSPIYFARYSDSLSERALEVLRVEWVRHLQVKPEWMEPTATLIGHADEEGDPKQMQELSRRRALAVLHALVSLGLRAEDFKIEALGDTSRAVEEPGEAMAQWNRRVELYWPMRKK